MSSFPPAEGARWQLRRPAPCTPSSGRGVALFPRGDFGDKAERWQAASAGRGHIIRAVATTSSVSPTAMVSKTDKTHHFTEGVQLCRQ